MPTYRGYGVLVYVHQTWLWTSVNCEITFSFPLWNVCVLHYHHPYQHHSGVELGAKYIYVCYISWNTWWHKCNAFWCFGQLASFWFAILPPTGFILHYIPNLLMNPVLVSFTKPNINLLPFTVSTHSIKSLILTLLPPSSTDLSSFFLSPPHISCMKSWHASLSPSLYSSQWPVGCFPIMNSGAFQIAMTNSGNLLTITCSFLSFH